MPTERDPLTAGQHHRPRHILVVDDDVVVRQILVHTLTQAGYVVVEAPDGVEALTAATRGSFEAAIVDLVMPNMDGIEAIQALRRANRQIKIVAISGASGGAYLRAAEHLGASCVLRKPFDIDEMLETLVALLGPQPSSVEVR